MVTTGYPARPEPCADSLPTPPAFDQTQLTPRLVARLVEVCPSQALSVVDDGDLRYDVGACTACGRCLAVAGTAAQPSGEFELAATDRDQLVKYLTPGSEPR